MKKCILALAALSLALTVASAQEIRYNYRTGGITRVSTEYEFVKNGDNDQHPAWVRLEYARFKDGSVSYVLYMNFEEKTAVNIPKGVRMAVTMLDGKLVRRYQPRLSNLRGFDIVLEQFLSAVRAREFISERVDFDDHRWLPLRCHE